MYRRLKILILIICNVTIAFSQNNITFKEIDALTSNLYIQSKWDSLIIVGKNAYKNDFNFFYLNMRMGAAYYSKKNYIKAIQYFKKAQIDNSDYTWLQEYLYFSYLNLNRESDKNYEWYQFNENTSSRLNIKQKSISELSFSNTLSISSINKNKNYFQEPIGYFVDGYQLLPLQFNQTSLFFGKQMKKKWYGYYGFNYLLKKQLQYYEFGGTGYSSIEDIKQWQFYALFNYKIKPGFNIYYSIQALKTYYPVLLSPSSPSGAIYVANLKQNQYVTGIGLSNDIGYFSTDMNLFLAQINNSNQKQISTQLVYYPLGNLNLYATSKLSLLNNNNSYQWIQKYTTGIKTFNNLWIELFFLNGNLTNYIDNTGITIYNDINNTRYSGGFNLIFIIKNININLLYQYSDNYSFFNPINKEWKKEYNKINYYSNILNAGIVWKF